MFVKKILVKLSLIKTLDQWIGVLSSSKCDKEIEKTALEKIENLAQNLEDWIKVYNINYRFDKTRVLASEKILMIAKSFEDWLKVYHYCRKDGRLHRMSFQAMVNIANDTEKLITLCLIAKENSRTIEKGDLYGLHEYYTDITGELFKKAMEIASIAEELARLDHCISGTEDEFLVVQRIEGLARTKQDWMNVYHLSRAGGALEKIAFDKASNMV